MIDVFTLALISCSVLWLSSTSGFQNYLLKCLSRHLHCLEHEPGAFQLANSHQETKACCSSACLNQSTARSGVHPSPISWSILIRHHVIIMAAFSPPFGVIFKEPSSSVTAANNVKWKDEVVAFQWMSLIGRRKRYGNLHSDEFFRECLTENQSSRNHKGGHPLVIKISGSKAP